MVACAGSISLYADRTEPDADYYDNGITRLPFPPRQRELSIVVHPFLSLPVWKYPQRYRDGLIAELERDRIKGMQLVFILQTPDAPRYMTPANPYSGTQKNRKILDRHNAKADARLRENLAILQNALPYPLLDGATYLVSESRDPTFIKRSQTRRTSLWNVFGDLRPRMIRIHGEKYFRDNGPNSRSYGCVNNVWGVSYELGITTELGVLHEV